MRDIALLGIDVGFSRNRPTTGIAWSSATGFDAAKTHTDWDRRKLHIPPATTFAVIAIDGPLVPLGSPDNLERICERLFIRGAFQTRCKPGLSHHGYGLDLRRAATETAQQVSFLASPGARPDRQIRDGVSIVEAFPNAFLGVLIPDACFDGPAAGKRKKFDWLYEHAIRQGTFEAVMNAIGWENPNLLTKILSERDHEKRAAWICLLTAACAASGEAEVVGDAGSGWFWLPPLKLWAPWATEALTQNSRQLGLI